MKSIYVGDYLITVEKVEDLPSLYDEVGIVSGIVFLVTGTAYIVVSLLILPGGSAELVRNFLSVTCLISAIILVLCLSRKDSISCGTKVKLHDRKLKLLDTISYRFTGDVERDRARVDAVIKKQMARANQMIERDQVAKAEKQAKSERQQEQSKECCDLFREVTKGIKELEEEED